MMLTAATTLTSCNTTARNRPHAADCESNCILATTHGTAVRKSLQSGASKKFLSGCAHISQSNVTSHTSRRRTSTTVHAGLFDRASRVGKGYAFFYGDSAVKSLEDPRKLLDQAVSEMKEDLVKMRQASAEVMSTQNMLESKYRQAQTSADQWYRRAELALDKGEEALAKDALRRKKSFSDTAAMLKKQLDQHTRASSQLMTNIRVMESKVAEAMSKKETLKARALSAETTKQLNESITSMVSGLKSSTSGSLAAFDRMEQKVVAMEAEAEAAAELTGNDALESRFALLEGAFTGVEDDFQKMKNEMATKGRQIGSTQTPVKPATIYWTSD